jgi:hypothetical protein
MKRAQLARTHTMLMFTSISRRYFHKVSVNCKQSIELNMHNKMLGQVFYQLAAKVFNET